MIVGIDEVGRGPWAGPVVAAAVVLDEGFSISAKHTWKLDDSKKLNSAQRTLSAHGIKQIAQGIGIGWVASQKIDELGLTESVRLAMRLAIRQLKVDYTEVIIDGNYDYLA